MPPELYQMPYFYPSRKLSKYWWSYRGLQFPALIIFSTPDFVVPGMWTNLYTPNSFVFFLLCFIVLFLFIHYLHLFCCLAKPITPLCWYLVVLGYLPVLHPIFTTYVHLCTVGWMVFLSQFSVARIILSSGRFRNLERGVQPLAREAQPKILGLPRPLPVT